MKELTLEARVDNIPVLTAWIDGELEALDCPMKAQMQIDIAMDEIFSNIARYAYPGGEGAATIRFDFDAQVRVVSITFLDSGIPYNPLDKPDPDTSLSLEEREVGGLGIFLVKKTMDDMAYQYSGGMNALCLKKKI